MLDPLVTKLSIDKRIGMELWGFLFLVLVCIGLSYVLPTEYGWENGVIENTQVVLLFFGVVAGIYLVKYLPEGTKAFGGLVSSAYFFLMLRELSWGRAFVITGYKEYGPVAIPMKEVPFHLFIEVGIGIYIVLFLWATWRFLPWRKLWKVPVPAVAIIMAAVVFCLGRLAEMSPGEIFSKGVGQLIEEMMELIVYCLTLKIVWYYGKGLRADESPAHSPKS